jgi:hypothetical protein
MDIPNSSPPAAAETLTLTALDGVTVTALRYAARRPVASGIAQAFACPAWTGHIRTWR